MKRTFAKSALALAIGCSAAGHHASAQAPPKTPPAAAPQIDFVRLDHECVVVRIDRNNAIWINESKPSTDAELGSWLMSARAGATGKRPPKLVVVADAGAREEVVEMMRRTGKANGFDVALAIEPAEKARVAGDDIEVERAVLEARSKALEQERENADDELRAAREQYQSAVQRGLDFLARQNARQAAPGDEATDGQTLREKLRPLVEESFEARQRLQRAELRELQARFAEIERAIAQRERHKDAIVDSRIEELLSPKPEDGQKDDVFYYYFNDSKKARTVPENRRPSMAPQPGPLDKLPPGTESRVVEREEQYVENGEVKKRRIPITALVKKGEPNLAPQDGDDNDGWVAPPGKTNDEPMSNQGAVAARGAFGFVARERLAQLDAEAAEEDRKAGEEELARLVNTLPGVVPERQIHESRNKLRQAERALKRAKATLEGLALERAELAAAADADVIEAEVEVKKAEAKVEAARANAETARAQVMTLEAEVESAQANLSFQKKTYDRMYRLATEEKAVDMKLVDEKEEKLHAAEGTLTSAQGAVLTGKARATQSEADVSAAEAELNVAQTRLRAAQARRERLIHRAATDPVGAQPSQGADSKPAENAKP